MRTRSSKGWGKLTRRISLALASVKLNGYEGRVLWAIVYKTIAFNKIEDRIPWSQFSEMTGIDSRHLSRTINSLLKKGIIFRKELYYGVQRDFNEWESPPNQVVGKKTPPNQGESPPNQGESPPNQADSRDPSKRAYQEKGLSASQREKKLKEFKKGFRMMKEEMRNAENKKKKGN